MTDTRKVHYMANRVVQNTACNLYVNSDVQGDNTPRWDPWVANVTCKKCKKAIG